MDNIIFTYIIGVLVVNLIWAVLLKNANSNLSFWQYFFISLLLTPVLSALLAIIEVISDSQRTKNSKVEETPVPAKLEGDKIWVANEKDKRIVIYESELADYIENGWHKIEQ
jgi:NADH:ubiquinone oxidoreductase subunit 6 (subunit J)